MPTISAIMITKNAEQHLRACLDALLWVDEIIVVDSGSTDQTLAICQSYAPKVKWYERPWAGFGPQKNQALALATSEWVLAVDADEVLSSKLQNEILQLLAQPAYEAYCIPRTTYFLGHQLRYGGTVNDAPLRLFKKGRGSFSEALVHEQVLVTGPMGSCQHSLQHFSFNSFEELLAKTNSYSTLGAHKLLQAGHPATYWQALGHAIWSFVRLYGLKLGFLDGWPGFISALNNFESTFYRYLKLRHLQQHPPQS